MLLLYQSDIFQLTALLLFVFIQVSYIKKIEPGSPVSSPAKQSVSLKPGGTPTKGATWKPTGTPNKGLTPQKSFKESIEEKAALMSRRTGPVATGEGLPPKPPSVAR